MTATQKVLLSKSDFVLVTISQLYHLSELSTREACGQSWRWYTYKVKKHSTSSLKVLLFDIESSPNLAYVWEKYEQNVISFEKERYILCFAYKWLGDSDVKSCSLSSMSSKKLIKKLHSLFSEADVIVAHNGDGFDIKMANAFFLKDGLAPPSIYRTVDTLKIARSKFRLNSNKLDDLGEYLGVGRKVETGGWKLWEGCIRNDPESWRKMTKYNKQDVTLLEKIYIKLRPWLPSHPWTTYDSYACRVCQGVRLQQRGYSFASGRQRKRFVCLDCGHWTTTNLKSTWVKNNHSRTC